MMSTILRKLGSIVGISLSVFVLRSRTVQAEDKIKIGISSLSPGFIPTIIAEKKGFYTKYGCDPSTC